MPPRKSTTSTGEGDEPGAPEDASRSHSSMGKQPEADTGANVEDYLLPRSLTQRLAKSALPPNTAIHKDAVLAISKAATVFVSYLSSNANEETQKKTIAPQDVLAALSEIEFDSFRPRLEKELAVYTENAAQKRKDKKGEGKEKDSGKSTAGAVAPTEDTEPDPKRVKRDDGGHEVEVAIGRPRPSSPTNNAHAGQEVDVGIAPTSALPIDDDETELDEDDHGEEGGDGDEEGDQEEEEDDEEQDENAIQQDDELEALDSDTAERRRNPDLDSDIESGSDGF